MNRTAIILSALFASQVVAHSTETLKMDAFDTASALMSHGVNGDCFNPSLLRELSLESGQPLMNPDLSEWKYTSCVESFAIVIKLHKLPFSLRELIKWE